MELQPKKLKKEINYLWKSISKRMEKGQMPSKDICQEIIRKSEDYNLVADKDWSDLWQTFVLTCASWLVYPVIQKSMKQ